MTITKHPESKYFSVLFMDADGKRVCRSLKTTDRTLATKLGADLELAARQARAGTLTTDKGREILNQILNASGNSTIDTRSTNEFFKTWLASKARNKAEGTATRYALAAAARSARAIDPPSSLAFFVLVPARALLV